MHELKMDAPEHGDSFRLRPLATVVLAAAATLYVLRLAGPVIVPVLLALLFAYALEPVVSRLVRWRMPRPAAAAIAFALLAILIGETGHSVAGQLSSFLDGLPAALADVNVHVDRGSGDHPSPLSRVQEAAAALSTPLPRPAAEDVKRVTIVRGGFDVRTYLLDATQGILNSAVQVLAVALLTFLLLATGDLYKRKLVRLAGPDWIKKRITLDVIRLIDQQIERYLVARLLISGLVAIGTGIPLWLLGVARPIMWGFVAGALNVIPFIGPAGAVALVAGAAFLQFHTIAAGACCRRRRDDRRGDRGKRHHAVDHGSRGRVEYGGGIRERAVLGLDVGRVGTAACSPHHRRCEGSGRSHRTAGAARRAAREIAVSRSSAEPARRAPCPAG